MKFTPKDIENWQFRIFFFFALFPWKSVKGSWISRMGQILMITLVSSQKSLPPNISAGSVCNENLNSFLTRYRWGNSSRRGNYSREETIWGNTVVVLIYQVFKLSRWLAFWRCSFMLVIVQEPDSLFKSHYYCELCTL